MNADIIFLDVGGIVLEIDWKHSLQPLGFTDQASQKEVLDKVLEWEFFNEFERGKIEPVEFFKSFRQLLDFEESVALEDAFNKLIVGPLPGVEKIFDTYSGKLPICALSNTNVSHYEYQIAKFPILGRFDKFLTSFELGHRKPDPEIYIAAAEKMNVKPNRALFFDDNLDNVEAAKKVGFNAFHSVNSPERTLAILKEFLG